MRLYGYEPKSVTAGLDCCLGLYASHVCDDSTAESEYAVIVATYTLTFLPKEFVPEINSGYWWKINRLKSDFTFSGKVDLLAERILYLVFVSHFPVGNN